MSAGTAGDRIAGEEAADGNTQPRHDHLRMNLLMALDARSLLDISERAVRLPGFCMPTVRLEVVRRAVALDSRRYAANVRDGLIGPGHEQT